MPVTARIRLCPSFHWHSAGVRLMGVLVLFALVLPAHGAVRRRLNVNSNPPGALVYVDNQQVGITPCSVDFIYYGTREIRLIKPGFETLTVNQPIPTPWYEILGLDFVSENLVPTKIRDNRTVSYNLAPQLVVPTPELLERANQLRQETLQYGVAPVAVGAPVGPAPAPVVAPAPSVIVPQAANPEPLPGLGPPPFNQPSVPQRLPAPPPGGAPLLPPGQ